MPEADNTQDKTAGTYETVVQSAAETLQSSRQAAAQAARRAGEGLESNPLGVVVGGLAVGALVGALVPRSSREKELLAPVGKRIGEAARTATEAARTAGLAELDQRGLTTSAVKDQARGIVDGLVKAATTAGTAAAGAASGKPAEQAPAADAPTGETLDTYQPTTGNYTA